MRELLLVLLSLYLLHELKNTWRKEIDDLAETFGRPSAVNFPHDLLSPGDAVIDCGDCARNPYFSPTTTRFTVSALPALYET